MKSKKVNLEDYNVKLILPDGRVFKVVRDEEFDGIKILCLKGGKPYPQLVCSHDGVTDLIGVIEPPLCTCEDEGEDEGDRYWELN